MAVPMSLLKPMVALILHECLTPLHYADLTRRALERLGLTVDGSEFARIKEDVREKILQAGAWNLAYTGAPYYFGVVSHWFATQRGLFNLHEMWLDVDTDTLLSASVEVIMRFPDLFDKQADGRESRARRAVKGWFLQTPITEWFRVHYPEFYRDPDNAGDYEHGCGHDFKLWLPCGQRMMLVDVAGPKYDGSFGQVRQKPKADWHILAEWRAGRPCIYGVVSGKEFATQRLDAYHAWPITRLLVVLNCERIGVYWGDIAATLHQPARSA